MFFLGQTAGTVSLPQVLNDIAGLLTGTITTTAGLSASFVPAGSTLISTVAPGWSMYDAAAGAAVNGVTPFVLRSAWSDSATDYKNLWFGSVTSFPTTFVMNGYHTWNSVTHTGTLPHVAAPTGGTGWGTWQGASIYANSWILVSASANSLLITTFSSNIFAVGATVGCFEFSRDDPWNTVANGYPAWFTAGDANNAMGIGQAGLSDCAISKIFNSTTLADINSLKGTANGFSVAPAILTSSGAISTYAGFSQSTMFDYFASSAALGQGADSLKNAVSYMQPIAIRSFNSTSPWLGGSTATKQQLVYMFRNIWAAGDEVDIAGSRYFMVKAGGPSGRSLLIKEA